MKVLLITREYPPYVKGGMCRVATHIAKRSHRHGIDVTIVANHPGRQLYQEHSDGVTLYRVPSFGSTFLTQIPSFGFFASKLVRTLQNDYDIVYSNYSPLFCEIDRPFVAGFVATRYGEYVACRQTAKPWHALLNRVFIPLDAHLIKKADGIIVNSKALVHEIAAMGCRPKTVEFIPSGVDTDFFKPSSPRQFKTPEKRILCVSRLDSRKGIDILIYAFKELHKDSNARLIIGGDGKEKQNLSKLAASLGLPVQFLGTIPYEHLANVYNQADLFVLPSLYEGMPLVALEAMACGTPTIVSDASPDMGIPRFKRGSVESLAQKIKEILTSEKKLDHLSKTALETSRDYSWDKIVDKTFTFLRKFL